MKLAKQTDYALRILIYSALKEGKRRISIQEVTSVFSLSRNHVMKIVQRLGQEGYLATARGRGGGFSLGKPSSSINVGEVVRMMESSVSVIDCDQLQCRINDYCRLKAILGIAATAFYAALDQYTLKDLIDNEQELVKLLL